MTIRFDLRPPQYRQTQKRYAVDRGKILFFLALLLMMLSSGGVAGYQAFRLHALSLSLMDLESSVAALQAQDGKLARTVQDLQQEIAFDANGDRVHRVWFAEIREGRYRVLP